MTCRELVEFLDDYLTGALSEEERQAFNHHLAQCPSCVAYMKTYQTSVELGKASLGSPEDAVPEAVPEDLVQAILASRKKT